MHTRKIVSFIFTFNSLLLLLTTLTIEAKEITVAVADFTNSTGKFRYDTLEKSVPEMLKTELSRFGGIVVVERSKLEAVLAEQALSQTGVIGVEDAQKVGQLVGAQYVIAGEITRIQSRLRLDAHIVQSQTGKVVGEKVTGPNEKALEDMVRVLATNIANNLSGQGARTLSLRIHNYYAPWVLLSAAIAGAVSMSFNSTYKDYWKKYESATNLDEIGQNYDKANSNYKARNVMLGVTGALLTAGVTLWLQDISEENRILASTSLNYKGTFFVFSPYSNPMAGQVGVKLCCRW